jgi:uncharacterized protein (DUF433 family)
LAGCAPTKAGSRDGVVLHVLAEATQFIHDEHADAAEIVGIATSNWYAVLVRTGGVIAELLCHGLDCYASVMKLTRITVDPAVCIGKPCIRGLRFPVARLLGLLAAGSTHDQILADYPYLEPEDIDEGLQYAAFPAEGDTVEVAR